MSGDDLVLSHDSVTILWRSERGREPWDSASMRRHAMDQKIFAVL
jgi:hypothetical protein